MSGAKLSIVPRQIALSLAILMGMLVPWVGAVVAAPIVLRAQAERELAYQRETNGLYYYDGGYEDDGDYVVLGQLPFDDYAQGGVYFTGSSEMNTSIMDWELTREERKLIHNYAIGDFRHTEQRHLLRMLVEEHGLLRAGGDRTTVIFALNYPMSRIKNGSRYVPSLFLRHGLYTYDWIGGVHDTHMPAFERYAEVERSIAGRVFHILFGTAMSHVQVEPFTRQRIMEHARAMMGEEWRPIMEREVRELAASVDYLQERGVHVRAFFAPAGSWEDELGYEAAYRALVIPALEARDVPVADYSAFLPDEDFMDGIHARYSGQRRMHEETHRMALEALAEMNMRVSGEEAHVR